MGKTESIEALLNPSLRVSRPVAACSRCRSAKIRCDGKLPACSACDRAGKAKECSSANDDFAKGKERSYVAALETAKQRLEKKIKNARAQTDIVQQQYHPVASAINGKLPIQPRSASGSKRREASDVDELVSGFGFLTVNATSRDFHGFTTTMSFARLLIAMAQRKPLPPSNETQLPSRYTITPLVDHYFKNIYVLLPFFSETNFMSALAKVYQDSAPSTAITPLDHWYARLVLAISAASISRTKGDHEYEIAMQHIAAAMKVVELVIHPGSTVGIQALLLLVQYSLVDPEYFDSWYLIGMASRLLVDLGLHCEPAPETKLSRHDLDLRRRVFYCTYALDRQIATAHGYAFSFTDDSAPNVLLPTLATDLERRSPTRVFLRSIKPSLFLFDIRRVQSSFYQSTRSSNRREWSLTSASEHISSVLNDIRGWHASLPDTFDQRHLQLFFVEYLYSQILTISPNQVVPVKNMTDTNKVLVFHLAIQFAEQMQLMVRNVDSQAFLTYADIHRVKFVGRQFQDVLWSSFDQLLRHQPTNIPDINIPQASPSENCARAISFISKTTAVLDWARARWSIAELREKFEQETAVLLARLQNKRQELSRQEYQTSMPGFLNDNNSSYMGSLPNPANNQMYGQTQYSNQQGQHQQQQQQQHSQLQPQSQGPTQSYSTQTTPAMHRSDLLRPMWNTEPPGVYNVTPPVIQRRGYEYGQNQNLDMRGNNNA